MHERTEILLGDSGITALKNKHILLFGVGGVGGYVAEMLIRTGIEKLTIVDFDVVTKSNLNRQIIALNSSLGKAKVEVMKARLLDINEEAKIIALNKMFDKTNMNDFDFNEYDYVIDAIDTVIQKIDLMIYSSGFKTKFISAMGTGNRSGIPSFLAGDIFETTYDGLARKIRKVLKKNNINELQVVFTREEPKKHSPVGSLVYYPANCASVLVAKVVNDLL